MILSQSDGSWFPPVPPRLWILHIEAEDPEDLSHVTTLKCLKAFIYLFLYLLCVCIYNKGSIFFYYYYLALSYFKGQFFFFFTSNYSI